MLSTAVLLKSKPYLPSIRFNAPKAPSSHVYAISTPDSRDTSTKQDLVSYLIDNVDGFVAQQATSVYPQLAELEYDALVEQNMAVIDSLVPARIQGQLFSAHPQLLADTDMQSWLAFLTSFGFDQSDIADVLRATPEVFHQSNVYQVKFRIFFSAGHCWVVMS